MVLTKQKLWEMAKVITDRQRRAIELSTDSKVDWNMLEGEWFDWLEDELLPQIEKENEMD